MSIRGQILSSSIWSIVGTAAAMISSFLVFALMTRFLQPIEFGLVAFAAIFIDIARGLLSSGFPEALIQRKTWDETTAATAFWLNLSAGIVFAGTVIAVAIPLAYAYGSTTLAEIFLWLSASLVIDAMRGTHEAKLRRNFGYKALAIRTVISSLISGVVGVVMAFAGFGVWALVANRLVSAILQTAIILRTVRWVPKLVFSKAECGALLAFGSHMMGARLLGQMNAKIPEVVVGVILGPVALAFFRVASRVFSFLVQIAVGPIQATAFSAFARLKDAQAIGSAYLRMTRATALVSFPVFFGAAAVAPDFVVVCFGRQWAASGPIMTLLALVVTPATLLYFAQSALAALGRTRLILASNLGLLVANAAAALATVSFGVTAVAAGHTARAHITAPFALSMLRRGVGLQVGPLLRSIAEPALAAALMAVAVAAMRLYVLHDHAPLPRLAVCVVLGVLVYGVLLLTVARRYTAETMLELLPHLPAPTRGVASRIVARALGAAARHDDPPPTH